LGNYFTHMKKIFLNIFNAEPDEFLEVVLLLLKGFLLGIFISSYEVASSTLFLNYFDETTDLPLAIILTGVIGIISTSLFSFFQNRSTFSRLSFFVVVLMLIITATIGFTFESSSPEWLKENRWLVFVAFIFATPMEALILLIFWGMIARMFSLKQQKRILGGIDLGKASATLIAFFTIPFLLSFLPNTSDLFLFSMGSLVLFLITLTTLVLKSKNLHFAGRKKALKEEQENQSYSVLSMLKNPYILIIILYTLFSTVGSTFIDYSFLNALSSQYTDEKQLGSFIAFFGGTTIIFAILSQTFVADKVAENYGLKVTLIINPILLFAFTLLAVVVGSVLGFTPNNSSFLLFFLALALGKLFNESLKDAFDEPTLKLFFFPIDSRFRLDVSTKLDGLFKVISGLIAGVLLLLIDYVKIFNLLSFSYFLLPILLGWIFLVLRLFTRYREALKDTLLQGNKMENEIASEAELSISTEIILENYILKGNIEQKKLGLDILENIAPHHFMKLAPEIYEEMPKDFKNYLTTYFQPPQIEVFMGDEETLQNYGRSYDISKRKEVVKYLKFYGDASLHTPLLKRLLKDPEDYIRREAALAAQHFPSEDVWVLLINLLADEQTDSAAASSLKMAGDKAISLLSRAFYKSNQEDDVLIWIIIIMRYVGSETAIQFLWEQIDHPSQDIVEQVLISFSVLGLDIPKEKEGMIDYFLEVEMGDAVWDVAALDELENVDFNKPLKQSLWEEIKYNFDTIFNLLELLYEQKSVQLVKDNLEENTSEAKVFALELLDVFIDEKLKKNLLPIIESVDAIIDDIDSVKKNEALQVYFPREDLSQDEVLRNLMIRDYKFTNSWTRACAMYSLSFLKQSIKLDELIANLFHPDMLLSETAAWVIYQKDPTLLTKLLERLPQEQAEILHKNIILQKDWDRSPHPLKFQKIFFLREVGGLSKNIPGDLLAQLVDIIEEKYIEKGQLIEFEGNSIGIIAKGLLQKEYGASLKTKDIFGIEWQAKNVKIPIKALEDSVVYFFPKIELYKMMRISYHFLQLFLKNTREIETSNIE